MTWGCCSNEGVGSPPLLSTQQPDRAVQQACCLGGDAVRTLRLPFLRSKAAATLPARTPELSASSLQGRGRDPGPAGTPVTGHGWAWHLPGMRRFQGRGGGRSPAQTQATSFTTTLTFRAGSTHDSWFRAKTCQSRQPATVTSSSQGKQPNDSICCQSTAETTSRLLSLFLSDPARAAVVMQLETLADTTNIKTLKDEIKKNRRLTVVLSAT